MRKRYRPCGWVTSSLQLLLVGLLLLTAIGVLNPVPAERLHPRTVVQDVGAGQSRPAPAIATAIASHDSTASAGMLEPAQTQSNLVSLSFAGDESSVLPTWPAWHPPLAADQRPSIPVSTAAVVRIKEPRSPYRRGRVVIEDMLPAPNVAAESERDYVLPGPGVAQPPAEARFDPEALIID